jgi:ribonuclease HI
LKSSWDSLHCIYSWKQRPKQEFIDWIAMVNGNPNETNKNTGVGVYDYGTRQKLGFSHGQYTTVFQAEVYAIKACVAKNLNINYINKNIHILSDSQAVIKALRNHRITSKLVRDCHHSLMQLAEHNRVQLIWMQGHEG